MAGDSFAQQPSARIEAKLGIGHWRYHPAGDHFTLSPGMIQLLGISDTCRSNRKCDFETVMQCLTNSCRTHFKESLRSLCAGEFLELKLSTRHGIHLHLTGEEDNDNNIVGLAQDVTMRHKAEEQAELERTKLSHISSAIPGALYQFQIENGNFRLTFISDGIRELTGYTPGEIEQMEGRFRQFIPEEDFNLLQRSLLQARRSHSACKCEFRFKTQSGQYRWLYSSSLPATTQGQNHQWYGIIIDISEQKQYEQQLEESLQEKEVLLTEMHHRVKNNLAVISGLLELQTDHAPTGIVQEILNNSQNRIHTLALVHEKIYQNQKLSSIQIDEVVRGLIEQFQSAARQSDSSLPAPKLSISADPITLTASEAIPLALIINELLSNAINHAFKQTLETPCVDVKITLNANQVQLTVADNGAGLPQKMNPHDPSSLGMTLVNLLVDQLEGEMHYFESNGSTFRIQFSATKIEKKASQLPIN